MRHPLVRHSCLTALLGSAIILTSAAPRLSGHKAVTSKYTFNQDVLPIVRQRCAPCHVSGGPSPMSLMTYLEASPWAESMKEELTSERMPPWFVDPEGPRVVGAHTLTARELDVLLTWVSGGAPEGAPNEATTDAAATPGWNGGAPDVVLPLPVAHTLPANVEEDTHDFLLPSGLTKDTWVAAVDLRPGHAGMVRSAIIGVKDGPVLGVWLPGQAFQRAPSGTGFRIPANAMLTVQIRYKKPWQDAEKALSDRSTVGLHLAGGAPRMVPVEARTSVASAMRVAAGERVLAVRLTLDRPYTRAEVRARQPDGKSVTLLSLRKPRPEWMARNWLAEPVQLAPNSTIEVHLEPAGDAQAAGVEICSTTHK